MHVDLVTVATRQYTDFLADLLPDVERRFFPSATVTLHVFTNEERLDDLPRITTDRVELRPHIVPAYGWPEATLLRYRMITSIHEELRGDVCAYLDVDMRLLDEVGPELSPDQWSSGVALVRHPGFVNRRLRRGTWETSKRSRAFVPRTRRRTYVCGGFWLGRTGPFRAMTEELADRVDDDRDRDVMALWHDESHLNWYAAHHDVTLLGAEYCWVEEWAERLAVARPRVLAVTKGADFVREPTSVASHNERRD